MNLGVIVSAVAFSATTALAHGIGALLQKNVGASVTIKKNRDTVIKGTDASGICQIFQKLKRANLVWPHR
jgi:hypothetical protein